MSDDSRESDIEIVRSAYAEKVRDAFIAFADNLSTGQQEKGCRDRFVRALELARKARDMAILSLRNPDELTGEHVETAKPDAPAEALSAEDQALVDSVLAGTTGAPHVAPPPTRFGHKS